MERPQQNRIPRWRVEALELIEEITLAAEHIGEARSMFGERVYATDSQSRLLRVVERSPYASRLLTPLELSVSHGKPPAGSPTPRPQRIT